MVSASPKLPPPRRAPRSVESSPLAPRGSPAVHSASSSPEYGNLRKPAQLIASPSSTVSMSTSTTSDEDLPSNVSTEAQLATIPDVCLSGNKKRPLRHVNEKGDVSTYSLQPMFYSVIFILLVELLERFSFYGVNYTQTSFLTGEYDRTWNAGMSAIAASSYVSISTAVAYSTPFIGAILADCVFGDYWSILVGAIFFYIPGLILITLSSVPYLLGESFNEMALAFGLLFLWPLGTGIVKSIVNVFGAKQVRELSITFVETAIMIEELDLT
jgi:POT family proton-dependent oligopeptide transporter